MAQAPLSALQLLQYTAQQIGECAALVRRGLARDDHESMEDLLGMIEMYAGELGYVPSPTFDAEIDALEADVQEDN